MKEKKGKTQERIKVLKMIAADMKNDAKNFDGRPFNGRAVAEYFGNQGAAISALARIMKSILEQTDKDFTTDEKGRGLYKGEIIGVKAKEAADL